MHGHIIGGAMLPHAPQFFTLPDSEDRATVANVQRVAADIGSRLRALYGAVQDEGVPEQLLDLLERLDTAEKAQTQKSTGRDGE